MIRPFFQWLLRDRKVGFKFGYCGWCEKYTSIMPGEILCEEHWLETK